MTSSPTIGVDLGGTHLRGAVVDADGRVDDERRESTPASWPELVDAMVHIIEELRTGPGVAGFEVGAVGVGAAGLVDPDGVVHYAPNIPALARAPLGATLRERLSLPVVVDNDANVAAWGELCHGVAQGRLDVLVITLGTGVGGGIVLGGRLQRGAHGFAGEVGHWQFDPRGPRCACGVSGHWEAVASGTGLGLRAREAAAAGRADGLLERVGGAVVALSGTDVAAAVQAGDPGARELLEDYARDVAIGFAGLANILDPEMIVVSGGLVELGDVLLEPLRRSFAGGLEGAQFRPAVPIVAATLGERAGVVGAAALARDLLG